MAAAAGIASEARRKRQAETMSGSKPMGLAEVVAWLLALEGKRVRVDAIGESNEAAPALAVVGTLRRVESMELPPGLIEEADVPAQSFRVGDGGELTLWPDRFLRARAGALNALEITTLDAVLRIEEERDPWT